MRTSTTPVLFGDLSDAFQSSYCMSWYAHKFDISMLAMAHDQAYLGGAGTVQKKEIIGEHACRSRADGICTDGLLTWLWMQWA